MREPPIVNEREIAGRAQYVRFTLISGFVVFMLLVFAQHNVFKASGNFWLGTQAGLVGAILSIAFAIRKRTVALDTSVAGNLTDSLLRLIIGAVSGGTLVLLFSTGLLPPLQTRPGGLTVDHSVAFAMLLGILAGFVEQLGPKHAGRPGQGPRRRGRGETSAGCRHAHAGCARQGAPTRGNRQAAGPRRRHLLAPRVSRTIAARRHSGSDRRQPEDFH